MKPFRQRVINLLRSQDWNIEYSAIPLISFFSVRSNTKGRKAYRVQAHGHITHKEQAALYEYGKQTGIHVLYAHGVAGREIEFIRMFPRNMRYIRFLVILYSNKYLFTLLMT